VPGGGATRPLPRNGSMEELHGDPTVGPAPKSKPEVKSSKRQTKPTCVPRVREVESSNPRPAKSYIAMRRNGGKTQETT